MLGDKRQASAALPKGITQYPLYRRLGGPQGLSGRVREVLPPPGFDPLTVQPVAHSQGIILRRQVKTARCLKQEDHDPSKTKNVEDHRNRIVKRYSDLTYINSCGKKESLQHISVKFAVYQ